MIKTPKLKIPFKSNIPRPSRAGLLILLGFTVVSAGVLFAFYRGLLILPFDQSTRSTSQVLVIRDSVSGRVYGQWRLEETGSFAIEFIHSVNQSPVRESFGTEGGRIRPLAVRFFSFGAGMQSDLGEGQTMSRDGDAVVITGFTNSFEALNYIVGTVSDHLLIINGEPISLRELCGKNAHITINLKT
jgi:hypothetical protein